MSENNGKGNSADDDSIPSPTECEVMQDEILKKFRTSFELMREAAQLAYRVSKSPQKMRRRAGIVSAIKMVGKTMHELHHQLGHAYWNQCWEEIPIGKERELKDIDKAVDDAVKSVFPNAIAINTKELAASSIDDLLSKLKEHLQELKEKNGEETQPPNN